MATHVLRGRRSECHALDRLVEAARAGESRALVEYALARRDAAALAEIARLERVLTV